ncbi:MAG TPA: gamma-glutamyltransferase family protein [Gaiellaceae bacterium]|jgi:gamma-glutamyltranspeptidase/glutathione hydrolase|nr:gamma-glutamyltransferase family protein [Gaiellaceae bacterium]
MSFTTRPELRGTFGAVASTHWLASSSGMAVLERGGNAFDAACAAGFVLQVVEPHLNGPGGDLPAVFWSAERGEPLVLCAQGVAPQAATIDRYRSLGHDLVPGTGLLAACVPGSFGGWLLLLEQFGTWRLDDVLAFAIGYAEHGYPVVPGITATIERVEDLLREWPGSAALYLPAPAPGSTFRNPQLAATWRRLLEESRGGSREQELERARQVYYEGFIAAEIDRFSGEHDGLLTGDDLAQWRATLEPPVTVDYRGLTVCKTGAWGQGPAALQQLRLLEGLDVSSLSEAELVHVTTECAKLAFADRDANYGDSAAVPLERLLSRDYADERRVLIGDEASGDLRPGLGRLPRAVVGSTQTLGAGEPTRGDTVHLDVADRFGNLISATPSGGWLQSSPTIPALGWPLGSRAQMFWLEEGLASSLAPGKRPRTTLSPGLVLRDGEPWLAYGTPGGDQQEQWALHVLLRHVDQGLNLQEAIDAPDWHTDHLISSFYPRSVRLRSLDVESRLGDDAIAELRRRGHEVEVLPPWSLGRVSAVSREGDQLRAAANPRLMQGYAVAR